MADTILNYLVFHQQKKKFSTNLKFFKVWQFVDSVGCQIKLTGYAEFEISWLESFHFRHSLNFFFIFEKLKNF